MSSSLRDRAGSIARVVFAIAGAAAVALLIRQVGARELGALLVRALPWMPLLLLLEGGRIASETYGTRATFGADASRLDVASWFRMHLVANAALVVLPAGRAICEGIKIATLSRAYGAPRAAALVTVQHTMTLLALAIVSIPCAAAAYLITGVSLITLGVTVHLALCVFGAVALQLAARRAIVPKLAAKWFVHSPGAIGTFRDVVRAQPWIVPRTLLGKVGNRVLQALQFGIILHAIGAETSAIRAFLADGVNLVGSALGEFMPAQVGAMDGSFALAAKALAVTVAMAMALANLARIVQLLWSVAGALVPVIARGDRPARETSPSLS